MIKSTLNVCMPVFRYLHQRYCSLGTEDLLAALVFFLGSLAPITLWVSDSRYHLMTAFNTVALPFLSLILFSGSFGLFFFTRYKRYFLSFTYIGVSIYFQMDIYDVFLGASNPSYALSMITQFFPLIYLASHFCIPQYANAVSWTNYLVFAFSSHLLLYLNPSPDVHFQKEVLASTLSQPVYLVCLQFILKLKRDLLANHFKNERLIDQLHRDPLTGIDNRISLQKRIDFDEHDRLYNKTSSVAVFMMDIDFFKMINDTYGHHQGDQVLIQVAQSLQSCIRSQDIVGRWGGEEFLAIAHHLTYSQAVDLSERFLHCMDLIRPSPEAPSVTLSIGLAYRNVSNIPISSLIKNADHLLYESKKNGRHRVTSEVY